MTLDMTDKVALITGAGGDIGGAAAIQFAGRGAVIVGVDRDRVGLERLRDRMPSGAQLECVVADVSDEEAVAGYVEHTRDLHGRIDYFFNNAGTEGSTTGAWCAISDLALSDFRQIMAVNARGVFFGLKHVLPHMAAAGSGAVVNTSSIYGLKGSRNQLAYVASKHAVRGMTLAAAKASERHGVRVNAIAPGAIQGRMLRDFTAIIAAAAPEPKGPLRYNPPPIERWSDPNEIAAMALFLFSDAASAVTGACCSVDGGLIAL